VKTDENITYSSKPAMDDGKARGSVIGHSLYHHSQNASQYPGGPSALGQYSCNFGKSASLLTSMPVTICILVTFHHLAACNIKTHLPSAVVTAEFSAQT